MVDLNSLELGSGSEPNIRVSCKARLVTIKFDMSLFDRRKKEHRLKGNMVN